MIGNSDRIFSSVFELEQAMVEAASKGELVLTATSRLSRRVLHCYRLGRIKRKDLGWKTPTVFGFNRWIKNTFDTLWEHFRPLSRLGALRLWDEVTQRIELPEGLRPGPSLNLRLQEAFDLLSRHGQALVGPSSGHTLADWRREVFKHFLALLEKNQYIPWTKILERVGKAVAEGRISLPENIILAGFNELANAEESLVKVLAGKSKVEIWHALKNPDQNMKVRVYATPEQECQSHMCQGSQVMEQWPKAAWSGLFGSGLFQATQAILRRAGRPGRETSQCTSLQPDHGDSPFRTSSFPDSLTAIASFG